MRLHEIQRIRSRQMHAVPDCPAKDIGSQINLRVPIVEIEPWKRRICRRLARPALVFRQRNIRRRLGCELPLPASLLAWDERFADDASAAALLRALPRRRALTVLVPGCYLGGEDVQFWLRRGCARLDGVDLNNLESRWSEIVPELERRFGSHVSFRQAPLERLPFSDGSFDVVATNAVLEHVQNLDAVARETARVLRPGGLAWHSFGPLYYSFGADHCIAAYGDDAGYDHLLLSQAEYQERISNRAFFNRQTDPNLPFWALHDQFSFATSADYLRAFQPYFDILDLVAKISAPGAAFRSRHPAHWRRLLDGGVSEADLLIKGLNLVLRRKA